MYQRIKLIIVQYLYVLITIHLLYYYVLITLKKKISNVSSDFTSFILRNKLHYELTGISYVTYMVNYKDLISVTLRLP